MKIKSFLSSIKNMFHEMIQPKYLGRFIVLIFCFLVFIVAVVLKGCNINLNDNTLSIIETISFSLSTSIYFFVSFSISVSINNSFSNIQNNFYFGPISSTSPLANAYKNATYIYYIAGKLRTDLNKNFGSNNILSPTEFNKYLNTINEKNIVIKNELSIYGNGGRFIGKEKDCFLFLKDFVDNVDNVELYFTNVECNNREYLGAILDIIINIYTTKKIAPLEE